MVVIREKVDFLPEIYIFSTFLTKKMSNTRASGQKWPSLGKILVNFGQKGPFLKFPKKAKTSFFVIGLFRLHFESKFKCFL